MQLLRMRQTIQVCRLSSYPNASYLLFKVPPLREHFESLPRRILLRQSFMAGDRDDCHNNACWDWGIGMAFPIVRNFSERCTSTCLQYWDDRWLLYLSLYLLFLGPRGAAKTDSITGEKEKGNKVTDLFSGHPAIVDAPSPPPSPSRGEGPVVMGRGRTRR